MTIFHDASGRHWAVSINVATIKRVKALTGVHLPSLIDDGMRGLGQLLADPIQLVDVLYALCETDAQAAGITEDLFGGAMRGDAIARGGEAFLEEFRDFFPDARVRRAIGVVITKARTLSERKLDELVRQAEALKDPSGEPTLTR